MLPAQEALLPDEVRNALEFWRNLLAPLLEVRRGITRAIQDAARDAGIPYSTLRAKYDLARKGKWDKIIDRRKLGPSAWKTRKPIALSAWDKELVKLYAAKYQRDSADDAAIDALRRHWREGKVTTTTPIDPRTGHPRGWSKRNLRRHLPSEYQLKAVRIGRSAAYSERPLVYTTRADYYPGQYYLFDDMWHDHEVNCLDRLKSGRPLEFHGLDLKSACKFAWGMRVRVEGEDGRMEGLKEADMRFLLAMVLSLHGYHPQGGTTLVVEHGTAAIRPDIERILHDATGGLIRVNRSGMDGAPAHAGQYAGRSKGNFRFKAALESLGNLIHNEMAYLPAQTGKDRDHSPEQLHGMRKHNDALLAAVSQLPAERIGMLQWDYLTIQQFRVIAEEIYARINGRTDHDLEGWDMHYVPDQRRPGRMRRLSPTELWIPGRRALQPLDPAVVALMLWRDCAIERQTRSHMIQIEDGEISGDPLRFDATALKDREKYATVLNPFAPDSLYVYDSRGRYVAECPRIHSVSRADTEAIQRACGAAAKRENELLQPLRQRHLADARQRAKMHEHNAAVLSGYDSPEDQRQGDRETSRLAERAEITLSTPTPTNDDHTELLDY